MSAVVHQREIVQLYIKEKYWMESPTICYALGGLAQHERDV